MIVFHFMHRRQRKNVLHYPSSTWTLRLPFSHDEGGGAGARVFDWGVCVCENPQVSKIFGCGAFVVVKALLLCAFLRLLDGAKLAYAPLERDWEDHPPPFP